MKPVLLYKIEDYPTFEMAWVKDIAETRFLLELYDPDKEYDPHRYSILLRYSNMDGGWFRPLVDRNFRVIIDHLWDSDVKKVHEYDGQTMTVYCPNWMWYLGCREFTHHGYESYRPNRNITHSFLMLMNNPRWHRDLAIKNLNSVLPTALHSYKHQNICIDHDQESFEVNIPYYRYMHPKWYDTTMFSVVSESYMRSMLDEGTTADMITEVSEKIFKPIAYYHSFIVYGSMNTLKYLRSEGFATFDNLFDEVYDGILDDRARFARVTQEILKAVERWQNGDIGYDVETEARCKHNHDHFFDHQLVNERIDKEVLLPILDFIS